MTSISAGWLIAAETKTVIAALDAVKPGASRFVGGCVRNTLLHAPVDDIDIATQLLPQQVIDAAKTAGLAAVPTGIEHGTITVVCNHKPYEVTTLRRDVTTDGRRATVAFTDDWNEDAQRRDFRLNALYADADGVIHDPTGGGVEDAKAGRIIFIGDAEQRLREDHLRILRFFRFSAWYGKGVLDARGLEACTALKDGVKTLSAERVWKELKKLFAAPDPTSALTGMKLHGVFDIAMPDAKNFARGLDVIRIDDEFMLPADGLLRIAAMIRDEDDARALARSMKASNDERGRLVAALGKTPRIVSYMSMREVRRALYALGLQTFEDRARIAWAEDTGARTAPQWRALLALAQGWVRPHLDLTGDEVVAAGVEPGPKVGAVMREVEAWWIDADFPDDKLSIVERLKAVAQGLG